MSTSVFLKFKSIHQISCVFSISILLCLSGKVQSSETYQYQAVLGENNQIKLIPAPNDNKEVAFASKTNGLNEIYMLQDASGVIKGMFPNKSTALAQSFQPGDTMQVFATSKAAYSIFGDGPTGLPAEKMEELAREASRKLLDAAKASACGFDPLPETISPTVQVSFSFFAGGSFSLQATWRTEDLCSP